jgi:hypothetical protein
MLMCQGSPPSPAPSQLPQNAAAFALPFGPTALINGQIGGTGDSGGGEVTAVSLASCNQFSGGSGMFTLDNGVVGNFTFMQPLLRGRLRPAGLLP